MFKNLYRGLTNAHCNSPIKIISINNEIINGSIKKNQQPSTILVESSTLRFNVSLFLFLVPFPSFFFCRLVIISICFFFFLLFFVLVFFIFLFLSSIKPVYYIFRFIIIFLIRHNTQPPLRIFVLSLYLYFTI